MQSQSHLNARNAKVFAKDAKNQEPNYSTPLTLVAMEESPRVVVPVVVEAAKVINVANSLDLIIHTESQAVFAIEFTYDVQLLMFFTTHPSALSFIWSFVLLPISVLTSYLICFRFSNKCACES